MKRAAWSLAFGISSIFCNVFTGIPAIILGLKALKSIRRGEATRRGLQFARTGVVLGASTSLTAVIIFLTISGFGFAIYRNTQLTEDLSEARAALKDMASVSLPFDPVKGRYIDAAKIVRLVSLEDDDRDNRMMLAQVRPGLYFFSNEIFKLHLTNPTTAGLRRRVTVNHEIVGAHGNFNVTQYVGIQERDKSLALVKLYLGVIPLKKDSILLMVQLSEDIKDLDSYADHLTSAQIAATIEFASSDDEILEFFASIK
ncbi:MAG TPA: DUF4190 domain-containing protein [Pirellulaceae bacterium]|nr:DUF4190 domain-containing protein [Pirellulaceae bacterium]HMO93544.1 DUF4190 domain-containing protein [Pirellulaceae bacterium]HMP70344.1 DUF4190 domain-containing protein [Pirellulaceae bacterium]